MTPIYVIGSSNTDMVVKCKHLPGPGETVTGGEFFMLAGGKGANQAVAAARLGGAVTFIANLGQDLFGRQTLEQFRKEQIDTTFISFDPNFPSGVALINVDEAGENSITVAPGANGNLLPDQVEQALSNLSSKAIVLVQLEIPMPTVQRTIDISMKMGHRIILNPAPSHPVPPEIYKNLFLITPNEHEAEFLTGIKVKDVDTAKEAARRFEEFGVDNVIITLGSKGALLHTKKHDELTPAPSVIALDTTGAGDCFNGALAVALSENFPLEEAVSFAVVSASLSVTRMGAQASMPMRKDVRN